MDCYGSGCVWRAADARKTDLEAMIADLMAGQYRDARRVIAFNTDEHWSKDVSRDVAYEFQRRADLNYKDISASLEHFLDRHAGPDRQLALRLA